MMLSCDSLHLFATASSGSQNNLQAQMQEFQEFAFALLVNFTSFGGPARRRI